MRLSKRIAATDHLVNNAYSRFLINEALTCRHREEGRTAGACQAVCLQDQSCNRPKAGL